MRSAGYFWVPIALCSALVFPVPASADTIRITSGFLEFVGEYILISNQRGLRIEGEGYGFDTGPSGYPDCGEQPCGDGDVAQVIHANGGGDLFVNSVTLDGVTFTNLNNPSAMANVELGFASTHVLPLSGTTAVLRSPFTFMGSFSHPGGLETLVGTGVVTTTWETFRLPQPETPSWTLTFARYDFTDASAVPEPTTLVLLGGATAVAAFRRRKPRAH